MGEQVSDWWPLRQTAPGFMTYAVFAVSQWLADMSERRITRAEPVPDVADAYVQVEQEDREDDPSLDELPLSSTQISVQPVMGFGTFFESSDSSSSDDFLGNEETLDDSSVASLLEEDGESARDPSEEFEGFARGVSDGVSEGVVPVGYSAVEGALRVSWMDDVLEVPLPGWTAEMVAQIVQGLQLGVWPDWRQALADMEPSAEASAAQAVTYRGAASSSGVGYGFGGWLKLWLRVLVVAWVCFGAVQGTSELEDVSRALVASTWTCPVTPEAPSSWPEVVELPGNEEGCDGSTLWGVSKGIGILAIWEITRYQLVGRQRRNAVVRDQSCQTDDSGFVPLPLEPGIPFRARILFSLWRAGYRVDSEFYPEEVQAELHWLIGDHLVRVEAGEASDGGSSG